MYKLGNKLLTLVTNLTVLTELYKYKNRTDNHIPLLCECGRCNSMYNYIMNKYKCILVITNKIYNHLNSYFLLEKKTFEHFSVNLLFIY